MSILAVRNVPLKATLPMTLTKLAKVIKGEFEAINFGPFPKYKKGKKPMYKTLYIKLSEKLDPMAVIEVINSRSSFIAFLPKDVPNLQPTKKGQIPMKLRSKLNIHKQYPPLKVLIVTHLEILREMQSKYTGLYNLAKKTGFKLLESIARTVFERLKSISDSNPECMENGFKLSSAYRKLHPHFGDFQLILSTLHKLQDAAGVPRAQVSEQQIMTVSTQPLVIDNVPLDKVQSACAKYSDRIIKKVSEHIEGLQTKPSGDNSEEEVARCKVRAELKKLNQYMPDIVKQVIINHFVPIKAPYQKVRIYGEPYLPTKDHMMGITKRCRAVGIKRSDRMYNLLMLNIPMAQYHNLFSLDGTEIANAKLIIRSANLPVYELRKAIKTELYRSVGIQDDEVDDIEDVVQEEEEPDAPEDEEMAV